MRNTFLVIIILAILAIAVAALVKSQQSSSVVERDTTTNNTQSLIEPSPSPSGIIMPSGSPLDITQLASPSPIGSPTPGVKTFTISGSEFAYFPSQITVNKGDKVTINFTNAGTMTHNLVIDEFNVKTSNVASGGQTSITFTANKTGNFEYYCSIPGHRDQGMVGTLIVQ